MGRAPAPSPSPFELGSLGDPLRPGNRFLHDGTPVPDGPHGPAKARALALSDPNSLAARRAPPARRRGALIRLPPIGFSDGLIIRRCARPGERPTQESIAGRTDRPPELATRV